VVQPSHTDQVKKYFDNTGDYLEKSFGVRIRALAVRDLLRQRSNLSILDVGCGNGMISLQFAEQSNRLVLIDLSDSMLALARQNTPAGLEQGVTYLNLDFHEYHPAHLFDLVLCIGVIAHVSSVRLRSANWLRC
jgi:2-polyprenyl-3-methyl-5-hydroxy-6-metoxy-1,4-benzoquinol methylase